MDPRIEALNPLGQPIDGGVLLPFITLKHSQLMIRFTAREHVQDADHDGVHHRPDGALLASTRRQASIHGQQAPALLPHQPDQGLFQERDFVPYPAVGSHGHSLGVRSPHNQSVQQHPPKIPIMSETTDASLMLARSPTPWTRLTFQTCSCSHGVR
jgi:hypothetical protein